ncbi:MAG: AraC-like DNA-binding protein [Phenylobacterium sp.]
MSISDLYFGYLFVSIKDQERIIKTFRAWIQWLAVFMAYFLVCFIPVTLGANSTLSGDKQGDVINFWHSTGFTVVSVLALVFMLLVFALIGRWLFHRQHGGTDNPDHITELDKPVLIPEQVDSDKARNIEKKRQFKAKLQRVMQQHYPDRGYSVAKLAVDMAVSRRHLSRKMGEDLNISPREYIRLFRLEKSIELLAQGELPGVVSMMVGFSSHSHFGQCFKAQYQLLPSQYVKNLSAQVSGHK